MGNPKAVLLDGLPSMDGDFRACTLAPSLSPPHGHMKLGHNWKQMSGGSDRILRRGSNGPLHRIVLCVTSAVTNPSCDELCKPMVL